MSIYKQILWQSAFFLGLGSAIGYFTRTAVPSQNIAELFKLLGALVAVSGSLLGWSAGWLDQSRKLIKEIDYDRAPFLFDDLGNSQRRLIWRWGIALASAILVIISSILLGRPDAPLVAVQIGWAAALGFLVLSLFSIFSLFRSLLASVDLKSKLDRYEHDELRKLRNEPPKLPEMPEKMPMGQIGQPAGPGDKAPEYRNRGVKNHMAKVLFLKDFKCDRCGCRLYLGKA